MREDIKKAWIADLRSKPPQCKRVLYDGFGYCCLGRLGVVCRDQFGMKVNFLEDWALLPINFRIEIGLTDREQGTLSEMNDNGKTFSEIANYIEKEI